MKKAFVRMPSENFLANTTAIPLVFFADVIHGIKEN
jgi:hypothetical protein